MVMGCQVSSDLVKESGKYPSGVFRQGVATNFIKYTGCDKWMHMKNPGFGQGACSEYRWISFGNRSTNTASGR